MFTTAVLISGYSYLIFSLGLAGLLNKFCIFSSTIIYFFVWAFVLKKEFNINLKSFKKPVLSIINDAKRNKLYLLFLGLISLQAIVNFVGALGPELAFDALWYHLTIPKIYLQKHSIFFIPGGLLYYSVMPKLAEMLYLAAISINGEILAKLIHFSFGILILITLYRLSRKFLSSPVSLLAVAIFYANLVVGWMSVTAYIDLARTFFELLALTIFADYVRTNNRRFLIKSAVALGLAASTKLLSLGSLFIYLPLIFLSSKSNFKIKITNSLLYLLSVLLIPLPWFVFSFINTGNPVYPFFTKIYPVGVSASLVNPFNFLRDVFIIFTRSADPLSPLYLIILPLVFIYCKNFKRELQLISLYSLLAIFVWYLTPKTGGGRFILAYLPAFSILASGTVNSFKEKFIKQLLILLIIMSSIASIVYRGVANKKYLPVILGKQTKDNFLSKNLNFSFGDFYDVDGYFKKHIEPTDKVLIYDIHNLYYVDFPFVHYSYLKPEDKFNYVLAQNEILPAQFSKWRLVYKNDLTRVKLFRKF